MTENLKSEELNDISSHNFNLKNLKYVHMYRPWNIETYMYITSDTECNRMQSWARYKNRDRHKERHLKNLSLLQDQWNAKNPDIKIYETNWFMIKTQQQQKYL